MSFDTITTGDSTADSCIIQYPSANTLDVPVPSGADGLLSWDNSIPAYINTGINEFQLELLIGRPFTLTGANNPVLISTAPFGSYRVLVTPSSSNQATAAFTISKGNPASNDAVVAVQSSITAASGTQLVVKWPAGSGIQLQKNMAADDGIYNVSIIGL